MSQVIRPLSSILCGKSPFMISCRYRRGIVRNVIDSFENEAGYKQHLEEQKVKKKKTKVPEKKPESKQNPEENISPDDFNYYSDVPREILDLKFTKPNPSSIGKFSKLMLNMKSRSYRERHGTCLLEGKYLISDAMKAGLFIRLLYFSRLQNLAGLPIDVLGKTNLIKVKFEEIKLASEVEVQTEGLLAIASKQDEITRKKLIKQRQEHVTATREEILPVTLVCDNIRDAGNMGTLLRAAAAAGCEQVVTTKGCVDIWEPKVIRSGVGAHFKIPVIPSLDWEDIRTHLRKYNVQDVFISHHTDGNIKISDAIPNINHHTSKLRHELLSSVEGSTEDDDDAKDLNNSVFSSQPYYNVSFINEAHTVLILGGEVHGVSSEAFRYALDNAVKNGPIGERLYNLVNIPMFSGTECVNTAIAGGILLFEARRQLKEN